MTGVKRDQLFATQRDRVERFRFDHAVAEVFDDMIRRSVPGYDALLAGIATLGRRYARPESLAYDLGCSSGSASLALQRALDAGRLEAIEALDCSAPMIERAARRFAAEASAAGPPLRARCEDVTQTRFEPASLVISNFTLQFIAVNERTPLLQRVHAALLPGGVLILSEKCTSARADDETRLSDLHDEYRRLRGYSQLEIAQKRLALERVLVPESVAEHERRLRAAGFATVQVWFQCFNFCSLLALKG